MKEVLTIKGFCHLCFIIVGEQVDVERVLGQFLRPGKVYIGTRE